MSQSEIVISGFGGQGVLFAGHILAAAGMAEDRHVTWLPSYGPEMRGGTAHVTVIVADEPIGSPIVRQPGIVIALNKPSVTKYEPLLRTGGLLVVNSTLVAETPIREDVDVVLIPATETAEEIGSAKMANIVALGAMLAHRPVVDSGTVESALEEKLASAGHQLVEANKRSLARGMRLSVDELVPAADETHGV